MELDELKLAWQQLGQRMEKQQSLQLELLRERKRDRMRSSLRPLFWGQMLQVALGIALILLGVACWTRNPAPGGYFLAGVLVHAFGAATAAAGGIMSGLIGSLDWSAPVLAIQKRLGVTRRFYVAAGIAVGWPWWVMWLPVVIAVAGLDPRHAGAAVTPAWVWASLGIGVAGLAATWLFYRWARNPVRPDLARRMEASITGTGLRKAQGLLDELKAFEDA
ncbi:serine/threonine protein kinase [Stenotrophomonas sp. HITSZ_GD]|uniref:serine/threonine protein kinase n=1 Tax=Stenotrophomonas sp. HITSZ_GD TaxID=3037248 RepID=UPI00240E71F7|nr:serine/threonine protein kinase [Stenotrophomonas sp. HITSZ_GD]MDG2526992.1 serine/threonine protein kinase [Stenotrophomonas sp. HITSZ_GD]